MLLSLPIPPAGREVISFLVLACCIAGSAAVVYGITRRRSFAPGLALLLGAYGLFSVASMLWRMGQMPGSSSTPAAVFSLLLARQRLGQLHHRDGLLSPMVPQVTP